MAKKTARSLPSPTVKQTVPLIGPLTLESFNSGSNVCVNICLQGKFGTSVLVSMVISRGGRITMQPCLDLALARAKAEEEFRSSVGARRVPL